MNRARMYTIAGRRGPRSSAPIQSRLPRLSIVADCAMPPTEPMPSMPLVRIRPWRWVALAFALVTAVAGAREISAEQAVQRVQRETDGKILAVQTLTIGTRKVYRIKVLTPDGRMRVMQVPAEE
jgi:hypothetical protein